MREIVLDTETTGLNFKVGDRIIEVGCVELINHVATNNTLQFYCKVEKEISPEAQRVSGITNSSGNEIRVISGKPHITAMLSNGSKPAESINFVFSDDDVTIVPCDITVDAFCRYN